MWVQIPAVPLTSSVTGAGDSLSELGMMHTQNPPYKTPTPPHPELSTWYVRILPTFPLCFHRHIVTYVCRGDLCAHEQAKSSPFFAPQAKCQFLSEAFSDLLQTKLNTPSKFSLKHLSQITIIYLFRFTSLMSPLPPGYYFHEGRDYICSLYPRLSVNTQHSAGHIVSVQYIL